VAALSLVPLGFAAFCAFAYRLSGDPFGWLRAGAVGLQRRQSAVGGADAAHRRDRPQRALRLLLRGFARRLLLLHGVIALVFIALTPSVFTRLGPALGAYVAASLYLPLSGNALEGIGRYAATLFPVFILVGTSVRSRRVHEALLVSGALVLSLLSALFATWRPVY
jgi:hypothetical protein